MQHVLSLKTYFGVFAILLIMTAATVAVARVDLGVFNISVALLIAVAKATLVVLFFMHLKYSKPLIALVAVAGLVWLAILVGLTLTDYFSRDWLPAPPGIERSGD
jgi:cytochrome c oxidase subunit 4